MWLRKAIKVALSMLAIAGILLIITGVVLAMTKSFPDVALLLYLSGLAIKILLLIGSMLHKDYTDNAPFLD